MIGGALLSRRARRLALVAVGLPVAAWVGDKVADELADRRGETNLTKGLHHGSRWLRSQSKGPAARSSRDEG